MKTLFNLLWLVFGGIWMGIGWWIAGLIMIVTVVGIPWAKACFVIGQFAFWPFGRRAVDRDLLLGREDIGTGVLGALGNIVWFVLAGVWLGVGHVITAAGCFLTIIGIPFGIQHLKLAGLAFFPIGKSIVDAQASPGRERCAGVRPGRAAGFQNVRGPGQGASHVR